MVWGYDAVVVALWLLLRTCVGLAVALLAGWGSG